MSARDLLHQAQALPAAEQQRLLEGLQALQAGASSAHPQVMRVPDFDAYWARMRVLGMPQMSPEQSSDFDRWLAGDSGLS